MSSWLGDVAAIKVTRPRSGDFHKVRPQNFRVFRYPLRPPPLSSYSVLMSANWTLFEPPFPLSADVVNGSPLTHHARLPRVTTVFAKRALSLSV